MIALEPVFDAGWDWLVAEPRFGAVAGPDWPATIMTRPVTDRYHAKQSRNIGRLRLMQSGQEIVVYLKRHDESPVILGQESPARDEFDQLERAQAVGIQTPKIVAAGERRTATGGRESFLAVEELTGRLALHELIPVADSQLTNEQFQRWKKSIFETVARAVVRLHRADYFHQDLYLCHCFVSVSTIKTEPINWDHELVMIDFHRLRAGTMLTRNWLKIKDLAQFEFSTRGVEGVTPDDIRDFYNLYRQLCAVPGWLRYCVRQKEWRYYQHNLKHPQSA